MGEGGAQEGRRPARVSPHNYGARCYVGRQPTKDKWSFDISSNPLSHSPTKPLLFVPHPKCYLLCLGQDMPTDRPETSLPLGGQAGALSLLCLASPLFATANHPPAWNVSSIFCLKARFGRYFAKSFFCQDKFLYLTFVMNSIIQHWQE